MTDDRHLKLHEKIWQIEGIRHATRELGQPEPTAGYIWRALSEAIDKKIFLWNVVPFHLFDAETGKNRNHTLEEREECLDLLRDMIGLVKPKTCIAIGRGAQAGFAELVSTYVLHPSRHSNTFLMQMHAHRSKPRSTIEL